MSKCKKVSFDLPDCVWMEIFKYLEHQDILKLIQLGARCNWNPGMLAAESTSLWRNVTWRFQRSKDHIPLERIAKYLGAHTTSLKVIGQKISTSTWYFKLRARGINLTHLQYIDCTFDYTHRPLFNLPRSVTHLLLEKISFINLPPLLCAANSPFVYIPEVMPSLRSICFKGCKKWLPIRRVDAARKKLEILHD